jgi:hypothetical protein
VLTATGCELSEVIVAIVVFNPIVTRLVSPATVVVACCEEDSSLGTALSACNVDVLVTQITVVGPLTVTTDVLVSIVVSMLVFVCVIVDPGIVVVAVVTPGTMIVVSMIVEEVTVIGEQVGLEPSLFDPSVAGAWPADFWDDVAFPGGSGLEEASVCPLEAEGATMLEMVSTAAGRLTGVALVVEVGNWAADVPPGGDTSNVSAEPAIDICVIMDGLVVESVSGTEGLVATVLLAATVLLVATVGLATTALLAGAVDGLVDDPAEVSA